MWGRFCTLTPLPLLVIVLVSRQMAHNCKNCKFCIQGRKRGWRHASVRHTPSSILFRQTRCRQQVASGFYPYSNEKIERYSHIPFHIPDLILKLYVFYKSYFPYDEKRRTMTMSTRARCVRKKLLYNRVCIFKKKLHSTRNRKC